MNQADAEELKEHLRAIHADGGMFHEWGASESVFVKDVMELVQAVYLHGYYDAQSDAVEAVGKLNGEGVK